jgi:hypothetical protein
MNDSLQNIIEPYILQLPNGRKVQFENGYIACLETDYVDGLIIEGVWGFTDLSGYYRSCIQDSLGIKEDEIRKLCRENINNNDKITLILLHSRNPDSRLKAVVLVPTQHCSAYEKLATAFYGKPYRDFYYNTIYEALKLLGETECKEIAFAAFTGCEGYYTTDPIIGKCAVEAVAHYALTNPSISKIVRTGGAPDFWEGVNYFNHHSDKVGHHGEIRRELEVRSGIVICAISWINP